MRDILSTLKYKKEQMENLQIWRCHPWKNETKGNGQKGGFSFLVTLNWIHNLHAFILGGNISGGFYYNILKKSRENENNVWFVVPLCISEYS